MPKSLDPIRQHTFSDNFTFLSGKSLHRVCSFGNDFHAKAEPWEGNGQLIYQLAAFFLSSYRQFLSTACYALRVDAKDPVYREGTPGVYKEMSSILADQYSARGSKRDVVYLGKPIAPSYMSPNAGEGGVAFSQPMSTAVHRRQNKLWISKSIFNLWGTL